MKHTDVFILAVALLSFSCSGQEDSNSFSAASIRTLSEIVSFYSMTCLEWDSPVDISGHGLVSSDILIQMKTYGFYNCSVFDANRVMMPGDTYGFGQIILYIPYFMHDMTDGKIVPSACAQKDGFCPVNMTAYQFSYAVDGKGDITFSYTNQCDGESDNTFIFNNISIELDPGCITFECDTGLYDYHRGEYIVGRLSAIYVMP